MAESEAKSLTGLPGVKTASSPSLLSRLIACITCKRRAPDAKDGSTPAYQKLLKTGRELNTKEKETFEQMAWWSDCTTKMGAKVFVVAPRGPGGDTDCHIDMWKLFSYCVDRMHDPVVKRGEHFAVVWVQLSDHRIWSFRAWSFKNKLHEHYAKYLESVHVVHPSWPVRFLRLALWPVASEEFWDVFECHERIEFLDQFMSLSKLELPADLYEYDKFLDENAREMSKTMAQQMPGAGGLGGFGGFGGFGGASSYENDPEFKKSQQQMEELEKLLKKQAEGGKVD